MAKVNRVTKGGLSRTYTAHVEGQVSALKFTWLALIETRRYLGREKFDELGAIIARTPRTLGNWRRISFQLAMFLGIQGYAADALCYCYLGRLAK